MGLDTRFTQQMLEQSTRKIVNSKNLRRLYKVLGLSAFLKIIVDIATSGDQTIGTKITDANNKLANWSAGGTIKSYPKILLLVLFSYVCSAKLKIKDEQNNETNIIEIHNTKEEIQRDLKKLFSENAHTDNILSTLLRDDNKSNIIKAIGKMDDNRLKRVIPYFSRAVRTGNSNILLKIIMSSIDTKLTSFGRKLSSLKRGSKKPINSSTNSQPTPPVTQGREKTSLEGMQERTNELANLQSSQRKSAPQRKPTSTFVPHQPYKSPNVRLEAAKHIGQRVMKHKRTTAQPQSGNPQPPGTPPNLPTSNPRTSTQAKQPKTPSQNDTSQKRTPFGVRPTTPRRQSPPRPKSHPPAESRRVVRSGQHYGTPKNRPIQPENSTNG